MDIIKRAEKCLKEGSTIDGGHTEECEVISDLLTLLKEREWKPIEGAPRDGSCIWVANRYHKEICFWDKEGIRSAIQKSKPDWTRLYERPKLIWKPRFYMELPPLPKE